MATVKVQIERLERDIARGMRPDQVEAAQATIESLKTQRVTAPPKAAPSPPKAPKPKRAKKASRK